jgi:hypothetical protein
MGTELLEYCGEIVHMQAGQCVNQMGTELLEYCGDNDAQLGRINVFTTRPRAARTCPARCSMNTSPALLAL